MPWRYYSNKKSSVDDYRQFPISFLKKHGYLNSWVSFMRGSIYWKRWENPNGNIGFTVEKNDDDMIGTVQVHFTQTDRESWEKNDFDYTIRIEATPCHYGGLRWWFLDPCSHENIRCGVLYFQSNGYFAGRKKLNLSYDSQNTSHTIRFWNSIFPDYSKLNPLEESIKYPYRNGKPTRKMRRFLKLSEVRFSDRELLEMEMKLLHS